MSFWPCMYHVFGPVVPNPYFRVFRSRPKRCATKTYTESRWYHLEKCLLWPISAHLRCCFFGNFCSLLHFPVSGPLKKCTLIISVNRMCDAHPLRFGLGLDHKLAEPEPKPLVIRRLMPTITDCRFSQFVDRAGRPEYRLQAFSHGWAPAA